ncbi:TetR/AcrR family transcriptional regulator C-terminal domain-containing protein [Rhodovulum sulfidophilum]|uniref:TetR/AcrR family transcriptional regulator n=1 Tax=Rhodovulum sulfidophilum TaxID=35806 RepID=UPI001925B3AC|nr:TetR/AcrR family transcriptional regulator C-terminal domain-containing protein [Rhodovulum sulfidophilum]MBL3584729.1 TetR/AcrR family transcriptional regulator C-terminal domain-containing protein [Rhodovulum sulfidophilum]
MQDASPAPRRRGRKPGPRPRLSRAAIARAALDIGLDTVTLKALAAHLGADHSSLYRHVKSRADIVSAAADLALSELDWYRPEDGWHEMLDRLCTALWDLFERHPGLAAAYRDMEITPAEGIHTFADAVAHLQRCGFRLEDAIIAVDTLVDGLTDCFSGWHRMTRPGAGGQSLAGILATRLQSASVAAPDHAPQIEGMISAMEAGPRAWWDKRKVLILAGIEALCVPPANGRTVCPAAEGPAGRSGRDGPQ